jgi:hypothetical protein
MSEESKERIRSNGEAYFSADEDTPDTREALDTIWNKYKDRHVPPSTERNFFSRSNPLFHGKLLLNYSVVGTMYKLMLVNSNPQMLFFSYLYVCGQQYGYLRRRWPLWI